MRPSASLRATMRTSPVPVPFVSCWAVAAAETRTPLRTASRAATAAKKRRLPTRAGGALREP